jgi:DNA polymerase-3 subunit alpha
MVESLIKVGSFDRFGIPRSQLLASYEALIDNEQQKSRSNLSGQLDMFSGAFTAQVSTPSFKYPDIPERPVQELLRMEKEVAGMYFSGNLLDAYSKHIDNISCRRISELLDDEESTDKESATIVGMVTSVTVKETRKRDRMAFFTVEDKYGEIECIAFPAILARYSALIREDAALCIEGNISLREDEPTKLLVSKITELIENVDYDSVIRALEIKTGTHSVSSPRTESAPAQVKSEQTRPRLSGSYTKLYLRVPDMNCEQYKKALNLVGIFEGGVEAIFYDSSSKTYIKSGMSVELSDYVYGELTALLGTDNVVPK